MKRLVILGLTSASLLSLTACGSEGNSTTETANNSVESVEKVDESANEKEDTGKTEYNQDIVNDEVVKAKLMSIEHIINKDVNEEKYVVSFDIENKLDKTIAVQAREVSINGRMVDEGLLTMSTDISAHKTAAAKLEIQDYSSGELPELTGDLEMDLYIIDWENPEFEHIVPVKITIK